MKLLSLLFFFTTLSYAQEEKIIKQISHETQEIDLTLTSDVFVPNIHGYGCAWPGIKIPEVFDSLAQLKHARGSFSEDVMPIRYEDLEMRFCSFPRHPREVFGEQYVEGKNVVLEVEVIQEIVERPYEGHKTEVLLRETIRTRLFKTELLSQASVRIQIMEAR